MQPAKDIAGVAAFFDTLPDKLARNVLRGSLRASANAVAPAVREGAPNAEVAGAVRITTGVRNGQPYAKLKITGFPAIVGIWAEFGTAAHLIMRRGSGSRSKIRSAETAQGSLKIGDEFVGPVIHHPGARADPFMLPALDANQSAAVSAGAEYIRSRLADIQGLDAPDTVSDDDSDGDGS